MVCVISKDGHPLMPSQRHGKIRRLLKEGKAKVIRRCPFTVQLLFETEENVQDVTLGVDARCISGNPYAEPSGEIFYMRKVRRHNRQVHKATINKGGVRKRNQAPYEVKDFRLFDRVKANGREWYIHGRRLSGSFVLEDPPGRKARDRAK